MFKTIVVGLDGSETSDRAMRVACDLAKTYDATLHLVHSPQPQTVAFATGAIAGYHMVTTMPSEKVVRAAAEKVMDAAREIARDVGVTVGETRTDRGDPVAQIIDCAEGLDADLIVTGRRGLGSLGALVQGSTSLGVSHKAHCACLSIV
ncbi:universal stress protein [Shimia abyssi]|uniref:Nucleotide-binding universal stress UspA family protein n=1 Tax=Shimia abyssi TaxID=1662395 RepID=A0A2P8FG30_9RHOB|nr:universal stress protein [Shimia abyssi]PSL20676.1 nucleotide-binding universal stress UspA family protein [Shimia abyssi]